MYCFSYMCRICLSSNRQTLIKINNLDKDNIRIADKLKFCVPEINNSNYNLPDKICRICFTKLKKAYKFKNQCMKNENLLTKHATKLTNTSNLSEPIKSRRSELRIEMVDVKTGSTEVQSKEYYGNRENNTLSVQTTSEDSEGVSMYSISLNQWDLFETKFTCRCVKEFNSFTEETRHLCKNCEGGLLGFRLSKIKVGLAQDKYSLTDELNKSLDSPRDSASESSHSNHQIDTFTEPTRSELGFDYNDILLCKVRVNGLKKQISTLRTITYTKQKDNDMANGSDNHFDTASEPDNFKYQKSDFDENAEINNSTITEYNGKSYQCKLCPKGYTRRYNLIKHFASHPEATFYDCPKCSKKFIEREDLVNHEVIHRKLVEKELLQHSGTTPKTTVPKNILPDRFELDNDNEEINLADASQLRNDTKTDLNNSDEHITCGTCDRSFSHKSHLAIHLMTHIGKQEFKCDFCSKQFFRKDNLDQHVQMHSTPRKFDCPDCNRTFTQKSNMHRHHRTHQTEKLVCSVCNKHFVRKELLENHILTHAEATQKVYECTLCDKAYYYSQNFRKHMRSRHATHQVYKCTTCDAKFNNNELLANHASLHKADKSYCSICDRIFSKSTNMKRHMRRHSDDKVYTCDQCKKSFRSEYNLKQHSLSHEENTGRYQCTHCDKSYAWKSGLTRHIFSHKS